MFEASVLTAACVHDKLLELKKRANGCRGASIQHPRHPRKLGLAGVGFAVPRGTPYSVREWCRFLTKLSRLLSKTDCFQPVSFGTPCNRQFRCRGVSIINFACVMTDSSLLKTRKRLQRGFNSACLWDLCVAIVFAS